MTLGESIKILRERLKISQKELGMLLKCSQVTISSIEKGTRHPSYEVLKSISDLAKERRIKIDLL